METIGYSKLSRRMVSIDGGSGAKPYVVPRETAVRIRRSFRLFEDMVLPGAEGSTQSRRKAAWCERVVLWMRRASTLLSMKCGAMQG